jgi:cysteinyl-tRNA synthetase
MTIRFFILQAHYRGTVDFSNEALQAAEKGFKRLMTAVRALPKVTADATSSAGFASFIADFSTKCYAALDDDFNSPILIAELFEAVKWVNLLSEKRESAKAEDLAEFVKQMNIFVFDILGLIDEAGNDNSATIDVLMQFVLEMRQHARSSKNFAASDRIRDELAKVGISIKDTKDGVSWE